MSLLGGGEGLEGEGVCCNDCIGTVSQPYPVFEPLNHIKYQSVELSGGKCLWLETFAPTFQLYLSESFRET